jgi:hypothetical protein
MQRGPWAPFFVPVVIIIVKAAVTHVDLVDVFLPLCSIPVNPFVLTRQGKINMRLYGGKSAFCA